MKKIVILGAGTGGTIMANKLRKVLSRDQWEITIVDKDKTHYYQPGFLFIPFGIYNKNDVIKPKSDFLPPGVQVIYNGIDKIEPNNTQVLLEGGQVLQYDYLIVATGTDISPEETPGLKDGSLWRKEIFDFYTLDGAVALREFFRDWEGGRLVVNIAELPFKCPVAPLEFSFLADAYFTEAGIREKVDITFVTPLSGAFTKPKASRMLGDLLEEKNIRVVPDFYLESVDNEKKVIRSYDEQEIPFDVLTIVPVNTGSSLVERSDMGDDLNFIPTDKYTLQSKNHENIFVLGDASDIPTSKAGSVVHFASEVVYENLLSAIENRPLKAQFDGHSNCYIETGYGNGSIIDFNYDTEPLPGTFPLPGVGPFGLLQNTKMNHYGKVLFRWIYWHILLKGKEMPIESQMTMAGKKS
ncbi:MAG: NAD(P)/FAD-dependent oxidoreductase [Bacteroidales bacterium]|nr:NAD(P)/FAD-dependent oxidoreductase [Bacteroidales bacterium]